MAQFAEFLRRSVHARGDSLDKLVSESQELAKELRDAKRPDADFEEFVSLVELSKAMLLARRANYGQLERAFDDYCHNCYWRAQIETHRLDGDLADLERRQAELEVLIRKLLHERYGHEVPRVR